MFALHSENTEMISRCDRLYAWGKTSIMAIVAITAILRRSRVWL
jgi:hypothetical protein